MNNRTKTARKSSSLQPRQSEARHNSTQEAVKGFRQASIVYTLEHCRLFAGSPEADLKEIASFTVVKSLEKGDYLFREGDPSYGFFIVQRGAVNIHRVNAVGKEQVIHIFREGESFAEESLATEAGYPANCRAVEPTQVLMVRKSDGVLLLARRPDLSFRMLSAMAVHLHELIRKIEDLTLRDVETRLLDWLVRHCPDPEREEPHQFELTTSKQVLASELGTISATLSRTLAHLREQHLLEVEGKSVTVPSPARLRESLSSHLRP